jgi:HD-GYP domain-containing protein (c-di-GMP phosphodiesterase class II)
MIRSKALLSTMPELLAVVLDYYDFITGTHCRGVTDLALYIGGQLKKLPRYAERLDYDDNHLDLEMLGFNAVLHDIGKIMAPKRILSKTGMFSKEEEDLVEIVCKEIALAIDGWDDMPENIRLGLKERLHNFKIDDTRQQEIKMLGRLTPNELEVVRFHVAASELIRDDLRPFVEETLVDPGIVAYIMRLFDGLYHHERPDGSGYPYGYSGEDYDALPTAAKIILVADTYHALRSKRSYKAGLTHPVD